MMAVLWYISSGSVGGTFPFHNFNLWRLDRQRELKAHEWVVI